MIKRKKRPIAPYKREDYLASIENAQEAERGGVLTHHSSQPTVDDRVESGVGGEALLEAPPAGQLDTPIDWPEGDEPVAPLGNSACTRKLIQSKTETSAAATETRLQLLEASTGIRVTAQSIGRMVDPTPLALEMADNIDLNDPMQKLAAHQMAAIHAAGMQALGRAMSDWDRQDAARMLNAANRCVKSYAKLMEAVTKRQNGGEQKILVQYVTVNEGGQAVVGNIKSDRRSGNKEGGGHEK